MDIIKIAIADDNHSYLKLLVNQLNNHPTLEISIIAFNGLELIEKLKEFQDDIDIILMDIEMPIMNGVEACLVIKKEFPAIKVIALTTFDDEEKVLQMILNGASGYLLKDITDGELIRSIKEAMEGGAPMNPSVALKVLNYLKKVESVRLEKNEKLELLTKREREIIELIKDGLRNKEISQRLFISEQTVRKHIENIYSKLAVNNRIEAIKAIE